MGGCYFRSIIPYFGPNCYCGDDRESSEEKRKIVPMHIDPGLYPGIVDRVAAMNSKIRERLGAQAFEYNGIYLSVDKITQKIAVHLPEIKLVFMIQSSGLVTFLVLI